MRDLKAWREGLVAELRTIGDLKKLAALWSGATQGEISSPQEEVEHVFDDYQIDAFLLLPLADSGLSAEARKSLQDFRDYFARYLLEPGGRSMSTRAYPEILADPRWIEISNLARLFIDRLKS